jgi:hypothetical protein
VYLFIGGSWFVLGALPFDLFVASGTAGTLILLVAYALATVGAVRLLFFQGHREVAAWEIVVPALALLLIGYTLFRNVWPYPTGAAGAYPILALGWLVAGVGWVLGRPAAARRAGQCLINDEGLRAQAKSGAGNPEL